MTVCHFFSRQPKEGVKILQKWRAFAIMYMYGNIDFVKRKTLDSLFPCLTERGNKSLIKTEWFSSFISSRDCRFLWSFAFPFPRRCWGDTIFWHHYAIFPWYRLWLFLRSCVPWCFTQRGSNCRVTQQSSIFIVIIRRFLSHFVFPRWTRLLTASGGFSSPFVFA